MAIRARVATGLWCVERALEQSAVRDERVRELVDVLWGFVEQEDLAAVDRAWRRIDAAQLLGAVEDGLPTPPSYRLFPAFLPPLLHHVLWTALGEMYGAVE